MITINVIESCPHTQTGKGVIHMSHPIISLLAGAVHDQNEWIALLLGTRSADGLTITVSDIKVPKQTRGYGSCELVNKEPLTDDIVGVVHSHHTMRAFFSQTDDTQLNTRFPMSLVVATAKHNASDAEILLGFSYLAEGRVPLPCGSLGIVTFYIQPSPSVSDWPEQHTAGFTQPNPHTSLYHCTQKTHTQHGSYENCSTACGLVTTQPIEHVFGMDSQAFMDEVRTQTKQEMFVQTYRTFNTQGQWIERAIPAPPMYDDRFLKHWGYGEDY